jgi:hypothetical protein
LAKDFLIYSFLVHLIAEMITVALGEEVTAHGYVFRIGQHMLQL